MAKEYDWKCDIMPHNLPRTEFLFKEAPERTKL